MYQGMAPQDLYERMQEISENTMDWVVPSNKVEARFQTDMGKRVGYRWLQETKNPIQNPPILQNHLLPEEIPSASMYGSIDSNADAQLATKLGIPKTYYDRMAKEAPGLWDSNCNHWLENLNKPIMLRTWVNSQGRRAVRAILSNAYSRMDNLEIFKTVLPILQEQPEMKIVSGYVNEHKFYLKVVFPRVQGDVGLNDIVQSGLNIMNSETGQGAFKIQPLTYRLVCLNGMIIPDASLRKTHLGSRIEVGQDIDWRNETIAADDKATLMKIQDITRQATDESRFKYIVEQLKDSAERTIDVSKSEQVRILAKKESLNEQETDTILEFLMKSDGNSHWDLANAVTSAAGKAADYEQATNLETLGGRIVTTPELLAA